MEPWVRIMPLREGTLLAFADACPPAERVRALRDAIHRDPGAFAGPAVVLDLGGHPPAPEELAALEETVRELLGLRVVQVVQGEGPVDAAEAGAPPPRPQAEEGRRAPGGPGPEPAGAPPRPGAPGRAVLFRRTVRSGQRISVDGHLVVVGDVNPGAELVATGDIVVFGALRGTAHAGARGDAGAVIAALRLEPVQLRIGPVIGRPPEEAPERGRRWRPERAVVRGGAIVVEPLGAAVPARREPVAGDRRPRAGAAGTPRPGGQEGAGWARPS